MLKPVRPKLRETAALLDAVVFGGEIRHDPTLREQVRATAAAGLEPSLVETQQVGVRAQQGAFADLGEDVHEPHEVLGELRKYGEKASVSYRLNAV